MTVKTRAAVPPPDITADIAPVVAPLQSIVPDCVSPDKVKEATLVRVIELETTTFDEASVTVTT